MLKIKLARYGKKKQPHYRIIVAEDRSKRDGQYTALLGHYAPTQTPKTLDLNLEEYREWISKGAQPTPTVASLAKRIESGTPFPEKTSKPSKKSVAKAKAAADAAAEAAATPEVEVAEATTEAPAETSEEAVTDAPTEVTETPTE